MESIIAHILYFGAILAFSVAINLAFFAVNRYLIANRLHKELTTVNYTGPMPRHIWKTGAGTGLVIIGLLWSVIISDRSEVTVPLVLAFFGFTLLALGMQELLNFENQRIKAVGTFKK